MWKNGIAVILLTAGMASLPLQARADDDEDYEAADDGSDNGAASRVVIEENDGNMVIRLPQSLMNSKGDKPPALETRGRGLYDKNTGVSYQPSGSSGYRNSKTGQYEQGWICRPGR